MARSKKSKPKISKNERDQVRIRRRLEREDTIYVDRSGTARLKPHIAANKIRMTEEFGIIRMTDTDPLVEMHKRGTITIDMHNAGLEYRKDYEISESGELQAGGWKERVDGGTIGQNAPIHIIDALERLNRVERSMNDFELYIMRQVVGLRVSMRAVEKATGMSRGYISTALKITLEQVAMDYGLITPKQRTLVAPK